MFNLEFLYNFYGAKFGVDPKLLKAIAIVESQQNPFAVGISGDLGLMQINPRANFYDTNDGGKSDILGLPAEDHELFNPALSVKVAAQVLKRNITQFGLMRGIAVYNSWSSHRDPVNGPFSNQPYVDKVLRVYHG